MNTTVHSALPLRRSPGHIVFGQQSRLFVQAAPEMPPSTTFHTNSLEDDGTDEEGRFEGIEDLSDSSENVGQEPIEESSGK